MVVTSADPRDIMQIVDLTADLEVSPLTPEERVVAGRNQIQDIMRTYGLAPVFITVIRGTHTVHQLEFEAISTPAEGA